MLVPPESRSKYNFKECADWIYTLRREREDETDVSAETEILLSTKYLLGYYDFS